MRTTSQTEGLGLLPPSLSQLSANALAMPLQRFLCNEQSKMFGQLYNLGQRRLVCLNFPYLTFFKLYFCVGEDNPEEQAAFCSSGKK